MRRSLKVIVIMAVFIFQSILVGSITLPVRAAAEYPISGTVYLPEGAVAPRGGMEVTIGALQRSSYNPPENKDSYETSVTIPEGQTSADYLLKVPAAPDGFIYLVYYELDDSYANSYKTTAFHNFHFSPDTTNYPTATWFDINAIQSFSGVNMIITKMRDINGTVSLPAGETAPEGGLAVTVTCYGDNCDQIIAFDKTVCVIPEGADSAPFQLTVPPNERYLGWPGDNANPEQLGYRLQYTIAENDVYASSGYYVPNGTVAGYNSATNLDVTNANISGIHFMIAHGDTPGQNGDSTDTDYTFSDVAETDWFHDNIYVLMERSIISEDPSYKFRPNDTINVGEFIKLVVTSQGYVLENAKGYWAQNYINKAVELGLVVAGEYDNYTLPIQRGQMARIIARAVNEAFPGNLDAYIEFITDYNDIPEEYREYVLKAVTKGIITGREDGRFDAGDDATRAEAATMIARLIDDSQRIVPDINQGKAVINTQYGDLILEYARLSKTIGGSDLLKASDGYMILIVMFSNSEGGAAYDLVYSISADKYIIDNLGKTYTTGNIYTLPNGMAGFMTYVDEQAEDFTLYCEGNDPLVLSDYITIEQGE